MEHQRDKIEAFDPTSKANRRPRLIPGVDWHYRPVWDFDNAALILFALLPQPSYDVILSDRRLSRVLAQERRAELDIAAILTAAHDLIDLSRFDRRFPIIVQIHRETIVNERRQAFIFETLKKIPARIYRQLVFEIVGAAPGERVLCLSSFVARLKALRVKTAIRLMPSWPSGAAISTYGAGAVTLKFVQGLSEAVQMRALDAVARRAKSAEVDCGLWDIATRSMVVAAASSGVRYLSGPVIAKSSRGLSDALYYSPIDLYSKLPNL